MKALRAMSASSADRSLAAVRIAVALAAVLSMCRYVIWDYPAFLKNFSPEMYQPKGVLALAWPNLPPSAGMLEALVPAGFAASLGMLFGLATRLNAIVSCACALILTSILYSFG